MKPCKDCARKIDCTRKPVKIEKVFSANNRYYCNYYMPDRSNDIHLESSKKQDLNLVR